ncbi:MAG: hypothetical protein U0441_36550, partial [Polyangiaceae bacterium]
MRAAFAAPFLWILFASAAGCGDAETTSGSTSTGGGAGTTTTTGTGGSGPDPDEFSYVPPTCVYQCPTGSCPEVASDYACQNLGAWADLPHAESCGAWDGTPPTPVQGKCTATAPSGDAAKYAGIDPDDPNVRILAGGRRLTPAGADFVFEDPN